MVAGGKKATLSECSHDGWGHEEMLSQAACLWLVGPEGDRCVYTVHTPNPGAESEFAKLEWQFRSLIFDFLLQKEVDLMNSKE